MPPTGPRVILARLASLGVVLALGAVLLAAGAAMAGAHPLPV